MFTQPCFIRKNTPELRYKLGIIGLRPNTLDDFKNEWLAANYGMYISVGKGFQDLHPKDIDCGTNEDLFLAIAALRDDTDRGQWFVKNDENVWLQCVDNKFVFYTWINESGSYEEKDISTLYHKATVQELIEHFNIKGR